MTELWNMEVEFQKYSVSGLCEISKYVKLVSAKVKGLGRWNFGKGLKWDTIGARNFKSKQ